MNHDAVREAICLAGKRLWEARLIVATEGNLSARIGPDRILATPSGIEKGLLTTEMLIECPLDSVANGVSSEIEMHQALYRRDPGLGAVVHAHPLQATAVVTCGLELPYDLTPESEDVLGPIAHVGFAMPGTPEVAAEISATPVDCRTYLLSHHGAVTTGKDVLDALRRMETLERVAELFVACRPLGGARPRG